MILLPVVLQNSSDKRVGKIIFSSNRDGNFELYVYAMTDEGSQLQRLTNTPEDETSPAWSPDGTKIAYVLDRNAIYVSDSDGSNPVRLTPAGVYDDDPAWSPDGKRIAFSREDVQLGSQIYVMNADGTDPRPITVHGNEHSDAINVEPSWSPDGKQIVFTANRDVIWSGAGMPPLGIYLMQADGTQRQLLFGGDSSIGNADWSPVTPTIIFQAPDVEQGLISIQTDGSQLMSVLEDDKAANPSWSPDGTKIVFQYDNNIALANADGSHLFFITHSSPGVLNLDPDWIVVNNDNP
jgi:Tol biopolymer transport system component